MYILVKCVVKIIVQAFFEEVTVVGLERIPVMGPVIFVGNHNNKFVDASIIMATIPRKSRFLIATASLSVRVLGRLARWAGAIGVHRPQDMKYPGMGRVSEVIPLVSWNPEGDSLKRKVEKLKQEKVPTSATGSGNDFSVIIGDRSTRFPLDVKVGDKIKIDGCSTLCTVEDILDDDHAIVKEGVAKQFAQAIARKEESQKLVADSAAADNVEENKTLVQQHGIHTASQSASEDSNTLSQYSASTISTGDDGSTPEVVKKSSIERTVAPKGKLGFTIYPKVDQGDVYETVCQRLYEGDSITIFPEGGSHDRPGLLPLKPGVALMALNAALMGIEDVLIIPLGIHYMERHKFGSRAVIEVGEPLVVPQPWVDMYAGDQKREAVELVMAQVKEGLENCLIHAPDFDTIKAIELCAKLYPPERMPLATERSHQLTSLFTHLFNHFKDDPATKTLKDSILQYAVELEANGIKDHEVATMKATSEVAFLTLVEKAVLLGVLCVVVTPFYFLALPVKLLLAVMTERHRKAATAASTVKITGLDVVASYKILWMLVFMPLIDIIISVAVGMCLSRSPLVRIVAQVGVALIMPFITYNVMRLQAKIRPLARQVRCLYRVIISELDVWRAGERVVILDRIDLQLKVRNYVRNVLSEGGTLTKAQQNSSCSFDHSSSARTKKLRELHSDLERIIPFVLLDADTRRILRVKSKVKQLIIIVINCIDSYLPIVYRSAFASREEIL